MVKLNKLQERKKSPLQNIIAQMVHLFWIRRFPLYRKFAEENVKTRLLCFSSLVSTGCSLIAACREIASWSAKRKKILKKAKPEELIHLQSQTLRSLQFTCLKIHKTFFSLLFTLCVLKHILKILTTTKRKKKIQIVILCCSSQKADFPVSTLILHSLDNKFIPVYTSVVTWISKQNSDWQHFVCTPL